MSKFYPESKVEIQGLTAKYYDQLLNIFSLGFIVDLYVTSYHS